MRILKEGKLPEAPGKQPQPRLRGTCERCHVLVECEKLEVLAPRIGGDGKLRGAIVCPTAGCGGTLIQLEEHKAHPSRAHDPEIKS